MPDMQVAPTDPRDINMGMTVKVFVVLKADRD